jgi:hypothetical protein
MNTRIPIGEPESEILEFKSARALGTPGIVARAAVAMLNAEGGEIWIGIGETAGRAAVLEPVREPAAEKDRLWNHLVDTIEPAPRSEELSIEIVPLESEGAILLLQVKPIDGREPYAHIEKGGRHFVIRIGARVRPMSREEILSNPREKLERGEDPLANTLRILVKERERVLRDGKPLFWIRLQPSVPLDINVGGSEIDRLLSDPSASGNRADGWNFRDPYRPIRLEQNRKILGDEKARTEIHRDGWVVYRAPLEWLRHASPGMEENEIYPLALLEHTVSIFRLAQAAYQHRLFPKGVPDLSTKKMRLGAIKSGRWNGTELKFQVGVDLALISAQGWKLRPYSPRAAGFVLRHEEKSLPSKDLLLERPFFFDASNFLSEPDRCALRVLTLVYEAFGYSPDKIPSEFDQHTGRLVLPA